MLFVRLICPLFLIFAFRYMIASRELHLWLSNFQDKEPTRWLSLLLNDAYAVFWGPVKEQVASALTLGHLSRLPMDGAICLTLKKTDAPQDIGFQSSWAIVSVKYNNDPATKHT